MGEDLSCQVAIAGDAYDEFYPPSVAPGDCGTLLATGGTLYAPNFGSHLTTATGALGSYTAFTPISQTGAAGSGTAASPYNIVTKVGVGSTGLVLTQEDQYVVGQRYTTTNVVLENTSGAAQSVILYRAGDAYLANSDYGYGFVGLPVGEVAALSQDKTRAEDWVPLTAGSQYLETYYNSLWEAIGTQAAFPNRCDCSTLEDNGAGLSWSLTIGAGQRISIVDQLEFRGSLAGTYVALGDSYSAGEDPSASGTPGCHRWWGGAYPTLIRGVGHVPPNLNYWACGGAMIADFYPHQAGTVTGGGQWGEGPQLNHLTSNTRLVTLTVGGDDGGMMAVEADCLNGGNTICGQIDHKPEHSGSGREVDIGFGQVVNPCVDRHIGPGGPRDQGCRYKLDQDVKDAVAELQNGLSARCLSKNYGQYSLSYCFPSEPPLHRLYEDVASRAPAAQIVVLGYPELFPGASDPAFASGSCTIGGQFGVTLYISVGDAGWLNRKAQEMDNAIASQVGVARANGVNVTYVDPRKAFRGHGVCSSAAWIHNVELTFPSYSLKDFSMHPTDAGQQAFARLIESAVG